MVDQLLYSEPWQLGTHQRVLGAVGYILFCAKKKFLLL